MLALDHLPYQANSEGADFATELLLQFREAGKPIVEVPLPTPTGHRPSLRHGTRIAKHAVRYRSHKMGFGSGTMAFAEQAYELKVDESSSHQTLIGWLKEGRPKRILDLGCSNGQVGEILRDAGHRVTGIDVVALDGVEGRLDEFIEADLSAGLPSAVGKGYDAVLAADVFEHLPNPELLLGQLPGILSPRGVVVTSVPNFAHWYPRARVLLGQFDYERRGILDEGHLRFFTRQSFERLVRDAGLRVRRRGVTGIPVDVADRGNHVPPWVKSVLSGADRTGAVLWPNLFAYQILFELEPD